MKKITVLAVILLLVGVSFLSGCNESATENNEDSTEENNEELQYSMVGSWQTGYSANYGKYILTLYSNGDAREKYEAGSLSAIGTWTLNDDILTVSTTVTWPADSEEVVVQYKIHSFEDYGRVVIVEKFGSGELETWYKP